MACRHGFPTQAKEVSQFMLGLEKTKAKAGEISQSAWALTLEDMHNLYWVCVEMPTDLVEQRQGVIRYVSLQLCVSILICCLGAYTACQGVYLFAWLMMLHIDKVLKLDFESINVLSGSSE